MNFFQNNGLVPNVTILVMIFRIRFIFGSERKYEFRLPNRHILITILWLISYLLEIFFGSVLIVLKGFVTFLSGIVAGTWC